MQWVRQSRRAMIRAVFCMLLAAGAATSGGSIAHALTLDEAKAQGLVGEQPNGYLGVPPGINNPAVPGLVQRINAQRRAAYDGIAKKNATSLQSVEALAGRKLIGRLPAGQWFMTAQGAWQRK